MISTQISSAVLGTLAHLSLGMDAITSTAPLNETFVHFLFSVSSFTAGKVYKKGI